MRLDDAAGFVCGGCVRILRNGLHSGGIPVEVVVRTYPVDPVGVSAGGDAAQVARNGRSALRIPNRPHALCAGAAGLDHTFVHVDGDCRGLSSRVDRYAYRVVIATVGVVAVPTGRNRPAIERVCTLIGAAMRRPDLDAGRPSAGCRDRGPIVVHGIGGVVLRPYGHPIAGRRYCAAVLCFCPTRDGSPVLRAQTPRSDPVGVDGGVALVRRLRSSAIRPCR